MATPSGEHSQLLLDRCDFRQTVNDSVFLTSDS